jgi:hypothetical protein
MAYVLSLKQESQVSHPYKRKTRFCFVNSGVRGSYYENGPHNPNRTQIKPNTVHCKNIVPVVHKPFKAY